MRVGDGKQRAAGEPASVPISERAEKMDEGKSALREMSGAELKSMLKSSTNFKSLGGLRDPELKLSEEDLKWWRDAKFGLFIHWGLYSILGRGEWAKFNESIPDDEYAGLADEFRPRRFDANVWAQAARDAGMKYMVFTSRHHDGFAMWDSKASEGGFTSAAHGAKRDYVREYTDACRKAGLKVGLYYSPMDWRFPGYFHPHELLENALLMKKQAYGQVEELVSQYGKIDILWYDGGWLAHSGSDPDAAWLWEPIRLNKMVRKYNPQTVINPRSGWEGDFYCDEGSHEINGKIIPVPWEKNLCICSGRSWGWIPDDPVMSFPDLIRMMVNVFVRDGNVLLNVGPDRDGVIPPAAVERLRQVGAWMRRYGQSVYGTSAGPFQPVDHVYGSTYRGNRIYLHILDYEAFEKQNLPPLPQKIEEARCLSGGTVRFEQSGRQLTLRVEGRDDEAVDTIVELVADAPAEAVYNRKVAITSR